MHIEIHALKTPFKGFNSGHETPDHLPKCFTSLRPVVDHRTSTLSSVVIPLLEQVRATERKQTCMHWFLLFRLLKL